MKSVMPTWTERYLDRIGMNVEAPSLDYLTRLIRARLSALAFENISKMYYFRRYAANGWYIPDAATHAEHMHTLDFGGLCHSGNGHFRNLLAMLGFDCYNVAVGESRVPEKNGHLGTIVRLDGRQLYVDVAVGIPTDSPVDIVGEGHFDVCGSRAHLYPDALDPSVYHMDTDTGGSHERWIMNPEYPVTLAAVDGEIVLSNTPGRVFTSILCCKMWQPERRRILTLINRSLSIHHADGRVEKRKLGTIAEIEDVLRSEYGMPRLPVREAVEVLRQFGVDVLAGTPHREMQGRA